MERPIEKLKQLQADNEREHHIKVLENLLSHYKAREKCEGYYDRALKDNVEALQYAISSIKTDLKYNLMYEGKEIYTKADMVSMLEELKEQLREMHEDFFETEHFDEAYGVSDSMDVIQERINDLVGKDGNKVRGISLSIIEGENNEGNKDSACDFETA